MSRLEKVALARQASRSFPVSKILGVLQLARSTWWYHQTPRRDYADRHHGLRRLFEQVAREHPEYGYRRTTAEVSERHGAPINHKVVQRLHRCWGLPLVRSARAPRPSGVRRVIREAGQRANLVAGLSAIGAFEVVYTDFTELRYAGGESKSYLIVFPDHATKIGLGWSVGERATTELGLAGWRRAVAFLKQLGAWRKGIIVHHDRDAVFTSHDWIGRLLIEDQAKLSYALGGAPDNPEMESFFGRFKTENHSLLLDAPDLSALRRVVDARMRYYNGQRRHSSLGNRSPLRALKESGWKTPR